MSKHFTPPSHSAAFRSMEYDGPRRMTCVECTCEGWENEFAPDGCHECGEDMCLECVRQRRLCGTCYVEKLS